MARNDSSRRNSARREHPPSHNSRTGADHRHHVLDPAKTRQIRAPGRHSPGLTARLPGPSHTTAATRPEHATAQNPPPSAARRANRTTAPERGDLAGGRKGPSTRQAARSWPAPSSRREERWKAPPPQLRPKQRRRAPPTTAGNEPPTKKKPVGDAPPPPPAVRDLPGSDEGGREVEMCGGG